MAVREASDGGTPLVVSQPEGAHAATFKAIAAQLAKELGLSVAA